MSPLARVALVILVFAVSTPAVARAQGASSGDGIRARIQQLDPTDPAVGYALSVRREGIGLIGGGAAVFGLTMGLAAVDLLAGNPRGEAAPYLAGLGIPAGLAVLVAGLPAMIASQKFIHFYFERGPAPSEMARLKLIRSWRMDLLRTKRDTHLFGTAFLGGAALLSGIVWAVRDGVGVNGVAGSSLYDPADGITTLGFLLAGGSSALLGVLAHKDYRAEVDTPHRLYARVNGGVGPLVSRVEGRPPKVGVQAALVVQF